MSASDTWSAVRGLRAGALPSCRHRRRPNNDNRTAEPISVVYMGENTRSQQVPLDKRWFGRVIMCKHSCVFISDTPKANYIFF